MKKALQQLSEFHGGKFHERNFRWWNGHAYMDGEEYNVEFDLKGWKLALNYERLNSEFEKTGFLGGTHSSRNKCSLSMHTSKRKPDFSIRKNSWINRKLKKEKSRFAVYCDSLEFKETLAKSPDLIKVYDEVFKRPEFEPEIVGQWVNESYQIRMAYQTQQNSPSIVKLMISLLSFIASMDE